MSAHRSAILGGRKKEAERTLKCKELRTEKESMWNVKPKVITLNWKLLTFTQTLPEQRTGKARNQVTAKKQPYWILHTYCGEY
jgi:hypothetical protein